MSEEQIKKVLGNFRNTKLDRRKMRLFYSNLNEFSCNNKKFYKTSREIEIELNNLLEDLEYYVNDSIECLITKKYILYRLTNKIANMNIIPNIASSLNINEENISLKMNEYLNPLGSFNTSVLIEKLISELRNRLIANEFGVKQNKNVINYCKNK